MEQNYLYTKKILLIDDEPELLKLESSILCDDGFSNIFTAQTMAEGIHICKEEKPDLVLLDVMLPDGNGFALLESLRKFTDIPVVFVTAKDQPDDKLSGLTLGADDYIPKPFMPEELLLRIHAILRRCYKEEASVINLENCTIDFDRAEVYKQGMAIPLTAMEHAFLRTLARNLGRIVTIDAVCEALWGDNPFGYENSLNAHVRRIREKIELHPSNPVSLITIKGLGYKLITRK